MRPGLIRRTHKEWTTTSPNLSIMSHGTAETAMETIRRHNLLAPGARIVVGCSGGADSTCLLHLLAGPCTGLDLKCTAVYVDHGLRRETQAERKVVESVAHSVGADFDVVRVDVPARLEASGGSVQEVARELRYEALRTVARRRGADRIAVGHTRSDQAETLMLQLLRGAGTAGLAGMPYQNGFVVRPLLDVTRSETVRYCQANELPWFEDPSNQSDIYLRNRVRHTLLPLMAEFNPRIEEALARTAEILRADEAHLNASAESELQRLARPARSGGRTGLAFDVGELRALSLALRRRVIRTALCRVIASDSAYAPAFEHVEAVLRLLESTRGTAEWRGAAMVGAIREYEKLMVLPLGNPLETCPGSAQDAPPPEALTLLPRDASSGELYLPWAQILLSAVVEAPDEGSDIGTSAFARDEFEAVLDLDAIAPPLTVRARRPGDAMRPLGLGGRKKIKELMIDAKVPRWDRGKIPIVCDRHGIVWVVGHALDERAQVTAKSRRLVRLKAVLNVVFE